MSDGDSVFFFNCIGLLFRVQWLLVVGVQQLSAKYEYLLKELAMNVFTQVDCRVIRPSLNNTHQKNKGERVLPAQ